MLFKPILLRGPRDRDRSPSFGELLRKLLRPTRVVAVVQPCAAFRAMFSSIHDVAADCVAKDEREFVARPEICVGGCRSCIAMPGQID